MAADMIKRPFVLAFCALALSGCATLTSYDAAGDVHAFLVSIRDGDRAAFEAHVDRAALKQQLEARVTAGLLKRKDALAALGAVLAGPLADAAVDQLVQPSVFLAVAEAKGYAPSKPLPSRAALTGSLRALDDGRVCVATRRDGPCLLDFEKEDGVWKLVAFEGDVSQLKLR